MLKSIDHVVIVVKNIEAALAFYRDVIGCTILREAEWRRGEARWDGR